MSDKYDLIIAGAGPAGLTAGIYAARARLKTAIIEKGMPGGQIATSERVENYPGFTEAVTGMELTEKMAAQAEKFGCELLNFKDMTGLSIKDGDKVIAAGKDNYTALSLIIATGTVSAALGIPGEAELKGRGVSYCATCDGAFFKDKRVVVVGGGDSAIEEALFLTRFVSELFVVHRREELRAAKVLQEEAFANPKIKFVWNSNLTAIKGESKVESVTIRNKLTEEVTELPAEGVFFYVGNIPNTDFCRGVIELDERGYIVTGEDLETSVKGIFAAGDCRNNLLKQVATAVGEGALSAVMAERYISGLK